MAGVNEEEGGEGGWEGDEMLLGLETRVLDLKNHFPVAMRLLSLAMEDCQVIMLYACYDSCDSFGSYSHAIFRWHTRSL